MMTEKTKKTEELQLLERLRKDDAAAFEELVSRWEKPVYNYAFRMLGNREDAEDAAQETFLKLYTSLSGFRGDCALSSWIFRIASGVCTDMLRKRKGETVSLSAEDADGEETELQLPDSELDPAVVVERAEVWEELQAGLNELPEHYRSVLMLREIGGRSYEEIAEALSLDIGTVRSRIARARGKLCAFLTERGNFPPGTSSDRKKGGADR